ncbi:MAG: prolyl oligopeptidase family serine peptidase [Acidobacteriia bacterium]|nr:prolyl oligopeptidase family serine peptidase [Terriglobia bacterium]
MRLAMTGMLFVTMTTFAASAALAATEADLTKRSDAKQLSMITTPLLAPDGKWFVYVLSPLGDPPPSRFATVVVRSTMGSAERQYIAGEASASTENLKMSPSGRWITFQASNSNESPTPKYPRTVLIGVATGARTEFEDAIDSAFVGGADEQIVLSGHSAQGSFDLTTVALRTGKQSVKHGVRIYGQNRQGTRLAWADDAGLHVEDLSTGIARDLDDASAKEYRNLTWSDRGSALALFRGNTLEVFTKLDAAALIKQSFQSDDRSFPAGYVTVPDAPLIWRDNDSGVYFGIRPLPQTKTTAAVEVTPNLILWNARDPHIPASKAFLEDRPRNYMALFSTLSDHAIVLSDPSLATLVPQKRGRFALAFDEKPYDVATSNGMELRDYYLVDLETGRRRMLKKRLQVDNVNFATSDIRPLLSPDGAFVVYQEDGEYYAYEVKTGVTRNMTRGLPTRFYAPDSDRNRRRAGYGGSTVVMQGWSKDGRHILLSDYRDIWALPLQHGVGINLTGNGRRADISYDLLKYDSAVQGSSDQNDQQYVDLSRPLYFAAKDLTSGRSGMARWSPETRTTVILHWEPARMSNYVRATMADVYVATRSTAQSYPNYFVLDESWRPSKQLSFANSGLAFTSGERVFRYTTNHGDALEARLILPIDKPIGKHGYPTIVEIYEEHGGQHTYVWPGNPWLENGYALLKPSIRPRFGDPGAAALESVTEAVRAAEATGLVDPNRLGITGHSHGGYETYFIVSRTNMFSAAVPMAGLTDLISGYGDLYTPGREPYLDSLPEPQSYETFQPYIGGPWWTRWNDYVRNSPLFHAEGINTPMLMIHGDEDFAVPFHHAVEMFNALHRLGKKDVVLLQYHREDHLGIQYEGESATGHDVQMRMLQFFNCFLKGAPAPDWWKDGISYPLGRAPSPEISRTSAAH